MRRSARPSGARGAGLSSARGARLAALAPVVAATAAAAAVVPIAAGIVVARRAAALYETPEVVPDPSLTAVSVDGLPGWVRSGGDGTRWAVLLPGLGSHPLRHQDVAAHLVERGYTVLFAAHSARWPRRRHGFGLRERAEASAWLRFAAEQGATRAVLFGWSFGASLWLRVLAAGRGDGGVPTVPPLDVDALVLTGPLTDWDAAVAHGAGGGGLGRTVAALARRVLRVRVLARLAGQPGALRIDRPSVSGAAGTATSAPVPLLVVVHGDADRTVPLGSSRRLVQEWPGVARLTVVPGAHHGGERDADPTGWLDAVDPAV